MSAPDRLSSAALAAIEDALCRSQGPSQCNAAGASALVRQAMQDVLTPYDLMLAVEHALQQAWDGHANAQGVRILVRTALLDWDRQRRARGGEAS